MGLIQEEERYLVYQRGGSLMRKRMLTPPVAKFSFPPWFLLSSTSCASALVVRFRPPTLAGGFLCRPRRWESSPHLLETPCPSCCSLQWGSKSGESQ